MKFNINQTRFCMHFLNQYQSNHLNLTKENIWAYHNLDKQTKPNFYSKLFTSLLILSCTVQLTYSCFENCFIPFYENCFIPFYPGYTFKFTRKRDFRHFVNIDNKKLPFWLYGRYFQLASNFKQKRGYFDISRKIGCIK